MRVRRALLAALLVSMVMPTSSAVGATGFRLSEHACVTAVSAVASGAVYGAGECGGGVSVFMRRQGSGWRSTGVLWRGKRVEAVAADDTAIFVVMSCTRDQAGCETADPLGKNFSIGKLPHGGRPSALTQLGGTEFANDTATVAARGGRWWAAYTLSVKDRDMPGSGSQSVYYRKTVGGASAGVVPVPQDPDGTRVFSTSPSIALTGTGAVLAFLSHADREAASGRLQLATAGSDGRFSTTPYAPADGADAASPDVAFSGGRAFVAWARDGRPAVAFERDGRVTRIDLPHRGRVGYGDVSVAASGGLVTVSSAETFAYRGGNTTRVYARSLDATGSLRSTSELTAPAGRRDPNVAGALNDSTAARGMATVAFFDGSTHKTATQY